MKPKQGKGWAFIGWGFAHPGDPAPMIWDHPSGLRVLSGVEPTQRKLEYHVSVSRMGQTPSGSEMELFFDSWPVRDWEEDNHGGKAKHFWKPLIRDLEGDCECKESS